MSNNMGGGSGSSGGASRGGNVTTTSNAALSPTQENIVNRMREASSNDERSAYREAAAEFVRSLNRGETVTEFTSWGYQNVGGGTVSNMMPTVWVKNSDGTISHEGGSTKYTPEEWASMRWRKGGNGGNFLKGGLTPQQIANELSKITKKSYSVRK